MTGKGEVWTWTRIANPENLAASFLEFSPMTFAIVKLSKGPKITAQLTDLGDKEPYIGMPVEMVTRLLEIDGDEERGLRVYGYKFRPPIKAATDEQIKEIDGTIKKWVRDL